MTPPAWRQPLLWVLAVLAAAPAIVAGVAGFVRADLPVSDWALIELRVRDAGSADTPLLGPFSRYGWSHPGPLMFWLMAPLYRLFGSSPGALSAAAATLNAVGAGALVFVAARFGGRRLAVLVAGATCVLLGSMGEQVADPWNPWIAVVPFALFVFCAAAMAKGDLVLVPLAVALGSFLVQSHIGYVATVAVLGAWSVIWLIATLWRRRSDPNTPGADRRMVVAVVGASVLVALVAWSGPLVDQVTQDPGNLRAVVTYFGSGEGTAAGWSEAATAVGRELHPWPPWLGGAEPTNLFTGSLERTSVLWALPTLAALGLATVLAWKRRDRRLLHLAGVAWVGIAVGAIAVTRITGEPYFYLMRFWWVLAMVAWVIVAWTALQTVTFPPRVSAQTLRIAGVAVVVLASVTAAVRTTAPPPDDPTRIAMAAITDEIITAVDPEATYRVEQVGFSWFEALFALVNRLDAAGIRTVADRYFLAQFGERRVVGGPGVPDTVAGTLIIATRDGVDGLLARTDLELLARYDPLSPAERARFNELARTLTAAVGAANRLDLLPAVADGGLVFRMAADPALGAQLGVDIEDAAEFNHLIARSGQVAVFLDRSGTAAAGQG
jgi:hypothetical protein